MKKIFFCWFFFLLFNPLYSKAAIEITEIMYSPGNNPVGGEWVEIKNNGAEAVDLSGYRLREGGTAHLLKDAGSGLSLPAGTYAIIADDAVKFKTDYSGYGGLLFDSTFSLSDSGELLEWLRYKSKDDVLIEDQITYIPGDTSRGTGQSLQKIDGVWQASIPTPGSVNVLAISTSTDDNDDNTTSSTTSTTTDVQIIETATSGGGGGGSWQAYDSQASVSNLTISLPKVGIGRNRLATVGQTLSFELWRDNKSGSLPEKVTWSFGDGTSGVGNKIEHQYLFAGEYQVLANAYYPFGQAVARVKVLVVEPEVVIKTVNWKDGYVEIYNQGSKEINLGTWGLTNFFADYLLPKDTIIGGKTSIKIPLAMTGLIGGRVQLLNPIAMATKVKNNQSMESLAKNSKQATSSVELEKNLVAIENKLAEIRSMAEDLSREKMVGVEPAPTEEGVISHQIKPTPVSENIISPNPLPLAPEIINLNPRPKFWQKVWQLPASGLASVRSLFNRQ